MADNGWTAGASSDVILKGQGTLMAVEIEERQERASIRSVERAVAMLTVLAEHGGPIGVAEVAGRMGLHPATTHRMLSTLVSLGWVEQNPATSRYRVGTRMVGVGALAVSQSQLIMQSQDLLRRLAEMTGCHAYIKVLVGFTIVYLDRQAPPAVSEDSPFSKHFEITSAPAHCMSSGKLLLAHLPKQERTRLLKGRTLRRFTDKTITDAGVLEAEIEEILARGYATDRGERRDFLQGLAVPIYGPSGEVVAALNCMGQIELTPEHEEHLRRQMELTAEEISRRLEMMGD